MAHLLGNLRLPHEQAMGQLAVERARQIVAGDDDRKRTLVGQH
jgi:hypothetical protein